jgi:hypothetical protein
LTGDGWEGKTIKKFPPKADVPSAEKIKNLRGRRAVFPVGEGILVKCEL